MTKLDNFILIVFSVGIVWGSVAWSWALLVGAILGVLVLFYLLLRIYSDAFKDIE